MKKRYLIGLGALAAVILLVFLVFVLPVLNPDCTNSVGLGGKQFFENTRMVELLKGAGYCTEVKTNSGYDSYPQKGKEDYNGIGFIQAGSITFKSEMNAKYTGAPYNLGSGEFPSSGAPVKIMAEYIIGQSPMMMWLKDDAGYFSEFVKAGFVVCQGQVCYIDPQHVSILVDAAINRQTWTEIGINIPGTVNLGVPTGSGGRATTAMLLSCWQKSANGEFCGDMLTPEQIGTDFYHNAYDALFSGGGQIPAGDDSLGIAKAWFPLPSNQTPTVALFATESAYASWFKELKTSSQAVVHDQLKVRGVYLMRPIMTTFTMICFTEECKRMVESVYETDAFQQIMSEEFGVRSGMYTNAPTYAGDFIDPAGHYTPMVFPLPGVTSTISSYNKSYGK